MAKNKRDIDKEAKRTDIVVAATALFIQRGFEETSMIALANTLGVAPNTLYWYFSNKDELLVAVLDETLTRVQQQLSVTHFASVSEQVFWFYDQLLSCRPLISTVHARVVVSDLVREWHERFHQMIDALLLWLFTQAGVASEQTPGLIDICTLAFEGMVAHDYDEARVRRALNALLSIANNSIVDR